ncbi:hypothetical protein BC835DRAFT_1422843 [Cytidiella melzeri]|nr:hypothetical protein BC835DRAFT_1422843 [Cytidiella melzeri]
MDEWCLWSTQSNAYHVPLASPPFPCLSLSPRRARTIVCARPSKISSKHLGVPNLVGQHLRGLSSTRSFDGEQVQEYLDVLGIDKGKDGPPRESSAADDRIVCGYIRSLAQYLVLQVIATGRPAGALAPSPTPAPLHWALDISHRVYFMDAQIVRHPDAPMHATPMYARQSTCTGYEYTHPPSAPTVPSLSQSPSCTPLAVG